MLTSLIAVLGSLLISLPTPNPDESEPLKVCMISGSWEYDSEESLAAFSAFVEEHYPASCTIVQAERVDSLSGLEALEDCDVALFFTRRLTVEGEPLDRIRAYVDSGKPVVGVRTASHGFQNWLEMDAEIFGGNYRGHYRNELTTAVAIDPESGDHPIVAQVAPYESKGSLYKVLPLADDCRVLLVGTSPEGEEPLAWTRERDGQRVFYTSLGHQADFEEESFLRMLANGLFWAAGRVPSSP